MTLPSFTNAPNELTGKKPWIMLGWLLFAQILVAFVGRSLSPLGVFIGESLTLTNAQIGMLPAALFFGQFAAAIPAGIYVDRTGTRPLLLALSLCLGISLFLASMTTNFTMLLLLIVIGGFGYGAMHPTSNRGIIYWFEHKSRGTAMGIKQMGVTAGSGLAALLLVPLAGWYGWRPVVMLAALLLIGAGLLSFWKYRDTAEATEIRSTPPEKGATFKRLKAMSRNRPLLLMSGGAMGINGAQMCLNTYMIIYAIQVIGLPIYQAGLLLVVSEIAGSIGRIGWGTVSDRLFNGNRLIILSIIAVVSAVCSVVMAGFSPGTSFIAMAVLAFFFGSCVSGFNGLWMNAATELVPAKEAGLASGFSISVGSWGVILGPPLFGLVTDITGAFTAGWYSLAGLLGLIGCLFIYLHISTRKDEAHAQS